MGQVQKLIQIKCNYESKDERQLHEYAAQQNPLKRQVHYQWMISISIRLIDWLKSLKHIDYLIHSLPFILGRAEGLQIMDNVDSVIG